MSSELFANEPDMEKLQLVYSKLSEDPEAAIEELQRLADAGSTMSMIYIANLFQHGRGVPVDLKEYEVWLRRAEASGSVFAAYKLARLYMARHEFVAAENSLVWSASAGFLPSIARLGSMYSNGFGVAINKLEGEAGFIRAVSEATEGNSAAALKICGQNITSMIDTTSSATMMIITSHDRRRLRSALEGSSLENPRAINMNIAGQP